MIESLSLNKTFDKFPKRSAPSERTPQRNLKSSSITCWDLSELQCKCQSMPENSQIRKNKTNEKEREKHRFNQVRQLPTSLGRKEKELLLINQFRLQVRVQHPQYISRESTKKKKSKTLKSDQK